MKCQDATTIGSPSDEVPPALSFSVLREVSIAEDRVILFGWSEAQQLGVVGEVKGYQVFLGQLFHAS